MKQSEIWDVSFDPIIGSEQKGTRPAVIISGNVMNDNYDLVIVCPLTSKINNHRGNVILVPNMSNGLFQKSEILVFHVKSISKKRLIKYRGKIDKETLEKIKTNVGKILSY